MSELNKHAIEEMQDEAKELSELREDMLSAKTEITIQVLGGLLENVKDALDELLQGQAKSAGGKDFDKVVKNITSYILSEVAKLLKPIEVHPQIDVRPVINVDLRQVAEISAAIMEQNGTMLDLVRMISADSKYTQLSKQLVDAIERNNEFLKNGIQQTDYSAQLDKITSGLSKKKNWTVEIKRDDHKGLIQGFTIHEK